MKKQKVIIISSVHPWNDTRILLKQAISLKKKYDITLIIPAEFESKSYQGIEIIGLPQWERVSDRAAIRKKLKKLLLIHSGDIYQFHDPELIPMGLWIKYKFNKPVIYDIHEDYASYILDKQWIPKLLRYPISVSFKIMEVIASIIFDHNMTATSSIKDSFPSFIDATTISNYPLLMPHHSSIPKVQDELRFVYLGSLEEIRGIYNMLEAFRMFRENHPTVNTKFHVAGKLIGNKQYQDSLQSLFNSPDIVYHKQLPFNEGQELMDSCHVGIIPFFPLPNHVDAVPNKLFEYMSNGLYLLVSNFKLWHEIVVDNNVGSTFDPMNIQSIVQEYAKCWDSFDKIVKDSDNSRHLVHEKYRWETEEIKLFEIYQSLLEKYDTKRNS